MNRRAKETMNTVKALSSIESEELAKYLAESETWVEFKLKCGLPKSRRQDGIKAYLDDAELDYSHLPRKGQSGMRKKSPVWAIPEDEFTLALETAETWGELLEALQVTDGNRGTVKGRIRKLGLSWDHLKHKKQTLAVAETDPELFTEDCRMTKGQIRRLLLQERERKCEHCEITSWCDKPVPLKVVRKNKNSRDNRRENLELVCANCFITMKMK